MSKRGPWLLVGLMAATVAALLVVLLVGGGGDGGPSPEELLDAAPAAVDAAGTAHLAMTVDLGGDGPLDLTVDGEGAVEFGTGAGWFTVTLFDQRIEMRTDGRTLFVLPQGDTTWLATPIEEAAALGSLGTGPSEAVAFVDLLRGERTDVEDLGEEEVGGAPARHLRLAIDLESAVEVADERRRPALESLMKLVPDGEALPVDVWIDEHDRPVRQRLRGEVQGVTLEMTVDLSAWGEPLGATIPPEGAVRDVEPEELQQVFGAAAR